MKENTKLLQTLDIYGWLLRKLLAQAALEITRWLG